MSIGKRLLFSIFILFGATIIVEGQSRADSAPAIKQIWIHSTDSTWKDTRLINTETTKTPLAHVMIFRITHRFGDVLEGGGFQTLFGFDAATDINLSFEYGITNNLELGIGRSSQEGLVDGMVKYKLLSQNSSMPVSLALYEDAGITPELNSMFYAYATSYTPQVSDRLSYFTQLILDRRFSRHISLEVFAGLSHRNYVLGNVNPKNDAVDESNIPVIGAGGSIKLTKHSGVVFDYYYIISAFRTSNTFPYSNPLSIGYEIETGGHVFEINFSNASFINENNIIPNTNDSWSKGGFKLGFSISRTFNL